MASDLPAAHGIAPGFFPISPVLAGHVQPVPRRIRAIAAGRTVVDSVNAHYVWEHPWYPQFYLPAADVDAEQLQHTGTIDGRHQPGAEAVNMVGADGTRPAGSYMATHDNPALVGTYRFLWKALDAWFEEDEEVFGHPRSPFVRVDAVRSHRHVRVSVGDVTIAETTSPVAVFETGLPPRWYFDPTEISWPHLAPIELRTRCPYKGLTTGYWDVVTGDGNIDEAAWSYEAPTRQLLPIAGLVAFDDAKVDVVASVLARD